MTSRLSPAGIGATRFAKVATPPEKDALPLARCAPPPVAVSVIAVHSESRCPRLPGPTAASVMRNVLRVSGTADGFRSFMRQTSFAAWPCSITSAPRSIAVSRVISRTWTAALARLFVATGSARSAALIAASLTSVVPPVPGFTEAPSVMVAVAPWARLPTLHMPLPLA